MLAEERIEKILEIIDKRNFVSIKNLVETTKFSQPTITRDIALLVEKGMVQRVWGGVKSIKRDTSKEIKNRKAKNLHDKEQITDYALRFIENSDVIFLDEGTTISVLASKIKGLNLTIVTNSYNVFNELKNSENKLILVGGEYNPKSENFTSSIAIDMLDKFKFKKAFLSADGLDQNGVYGDQVVDCELKQKVIIQSDKTYILADKSKLFGRGFMRYASLEEITVITNSEAIVHENIIEINGEKND